MGIPDNEGWTFIIKPRRKWLDLRLEEIWHYRDLIGLFVWRDFVANYKQTILGPLWFLIQPLLTTLTFTVIFGNIAQLSTDGLPKFIFYMAGTTIWSYFAACFSKNANTFGANASIFGKVYFPRLCVPLSILISNFITFTIQFIQLAVFMIYFWFQDANIRPNQYIVLLPLLLMMMAGFGLGLGIVISALTIRYRDLQFIVSFGVQLLMYATPVIYPLASVGEKWRWLLAVNPLTPVVEGFRFVLLGAGTLSSLHLLYSFLVMLCILFAGLITFNRVEDTFMDTI